MAHTKIKIATSGKESADNVSDTVDTKSGATNTAVNTAAKPNSSAIPKVPRGFLNLLSKEDVSRSSISLPEREEKRAQKTYRNSYLPSLYEKSKRSENSQSSSSKTTLVLSLIIAPLLLYLTYQNFSLMKESSLQKKQIRDLALISKYFLDSLTDVKKQTGIALFENTPDTTPEPPILSSGIQVGEVTVSKGNLRLGPSEEHGVSMTVSQGSRLVVEKTSEDGEWHRVVAPSGERLWASHQILIVSDILE